MDRRKLLTTATSAVIASIGGCSSIARQDAPEPTWGGGAWRRTSSEDARGPTRGESDADVVVREEEEDDDVEYLESEDAVRFVSILEVQEDGGTPEPIYDTAPFEDFARRRCTVAAARSARDHVVDELQVAEEEISASASTVDGSRVATLRVGTSSDDPTENQEQAVTFDSVVEATPSSVSATYVLEGREYETDVPIYVEEVVERIPY